MKRYIRGIESTSGLDPVEAMAQINPQLGQKLTIRVDVVQGSEGPIPHMHVYHNKTLNPKECSYVRLDKAAYSEHHKDNKPLPDKLKEQFLLVMTTVWPKHYIETTEGARRATGYEAAVDIWSDTYEGGSYAKFHLDDTGAPIMPDYANEL